MGRSERRISKLMRDNEVRTNLGCSQIEVKNKVHVFVSEDSCHPMLKEINEFWEELLKKMKEVGYRDYGIVEEDECGKLCLDY